MSQNMSGMNQSRKKYCGSCAACPSKSHSLNAHMLLEVSLEVCSFRLLKISSLLRTLTKANQQKLTACRIATKHS